MHIFTYLSTFLISLKMNGITFQMFCQCAVSSIWEFNYLAVLLNQKNWLVFLGPRFSWINFENNKKAKLIGKYSSQMRECSGSFEDVSSNTVICFWGIPQEFWRKMIVLLDTSDKDPLHSHCYQVNDCQKNNFDNQYISVYFHDNQFLVTL